MNPLGLNLAAPALFAHGSEEQRRRYLPPIVRNEERWCQLFSEPGSGSDLASLATRAERDGDEWVVTGQKVWTTWAHRSTHAVLLARTDLDRPKRRGITYFLLDLDQPGVDVRPLRHIGGEVDFNEVFLDRARIPDTQRVGAVGDGLDGGERHLVAASVRWCRGPARAGVDRIGGSGADSLVRLASQLAAEGRSGGWDDPVHRDAVIQLWCEEQMRGWTNQRVRALVRAGRSPGPESSIGKVHQGASTNGCSSWPSTCWAPPPPLGPATQLRLRLRRSRRLGGHLPYEVRGMLRSRANTIEGGTTEVNKNILGERVLGLTPREPTPGRARPGARSRS